MPPEPSSAHAEALGELFERLLATLDPASAERFAPLREMLALAAGRERRWATEQVRHQRRVRLEGMLPKIAESLDVRKVFVELAGVIREVIPHDVLAFALLNDDRGGVRVQAATHAGVMELPEYRFSNPEEALDANWRFLLAHDLTPLDEHSVRARISPRTAPEVVEVVTRPGAQWMRFIRQAQVRSTMRVPIRLQDRPIGGIAFMSRAADAFDEEDGIVASRIADQLALALAHQELARHAVDQDRRERRSAALEAVLPRLGLLQDLDDIAVAVSSAANGILDHDAVGVMVIHSGGAHVHGIHDGVHRVSSDAPPEFVAHQFRDLMPGGSLRIRELELVDEARNLVRQRVAAPDGDLVREVVAPPSSVQALKALGVRCEMRIAIRQGDDLLGMLLFASRTPDHYRPDDEAIGRRLADRVSLRIAQDRIEGEARRAREASARASALEQRVEALQRELERFSAHRAIGRSAAWKKALTDATQVAATDTTVLVTGESGTGKEVIARYIHRGSSRAKGPFIALNCAALPSSCSNPSCSDTSAARSPARPRRGRAGSSRPGGVLFLDEVGEMSPPCRPSSCACSRSASSSASAARRRSRRRPHRGRHQPRPARGDRAGAFREDLYYRLSVFEIHLPPLRERPDDILVLAEAFLDEVGASIGRPAAGLSEAAREQLLVHSWPGNVRELKNAIERAVILCHGGLVTREHLPITVARPAPERVAIAAPAAAAFPVEGVALDDVERELVQKAMAKAGQNKSQAAKLLGLSRGQLYSLLRRHGLTDAKRWLRPSPAARSAPPAPAGGRRTRGHRGAHRAGTTPARSRRRPRAACLRC
jgi:transcriptional regulator with GAF, ATPase, and Fis domain